MGWGVVVVYCHRHNQSFAAAWLLPLPFCAPLRRVWLSSLYCLLSRPILFRYLETAAVFPLGLFFCRLNEHSSLSLLSHILCFSCWLSWWPFSGLIWYINICPALGSQNWVQYSRCGLTNAEQRGRITSVEVTAVLLPRIKLAFITARMQYLPKSGLSPKSLEVILQSSFLSSQTSHCFCCITSFFLPGAEFGICFWASWSFCQPIFLSVRVPLNDSHDLSCFDCFPWFVIAYTLPDSGRAVLLRLLMIILNSIGILCS